ncbi:MAG TPA: hypothetical protein PLF81_16400 [Candidatus Anammoximicrobium sp.]|nr:hypothetical protein [Candidatus Anammoximicrobium sp.]
MKTLFLGIAIYGFASLACGQSLSDLQAHYSGQTEWDAPGGTVTFVSSGTIDFQRDKEMSGIWTVPPEVQRIAIAADVRVTGQFTFRHDCTVEGRDWQTSVLYGTDTPALLCDRKLDDGGNCMPYSAVFAQGKIDIHVKNLTTLNPIGYMWTGVDGARIHLDHVRGIDNRGGWHNHSDGIQGGRGCTVRHCYLETGDDAIKVYSDIVVEDTTIRMIQNCVPIQLGWGNYGSGAQGVFRNLTILGDRGRGRVPPVIEGTHGKYRKTIKIDGLMVNNPNSALVRLHEADMELELTITGADITVKQFAYESPGVCRSLINGSQEQKSRYPAEKPNP